MKAPLVIQIILNFKMIVQDDDETVDNQKLMKVKFQIWLQMENITQY
jgi:hypothetical protein